MQSSKMIFFIFLFTNIKMAKFTKKTSYSFKRKSKKKVCKVSKCVKKYVKNALDRQSEDKIYMKGQFSALELSGPGETGPYFWDMSISIPQGTGQSQHVGSSVRIKSAYLNWRITTGSGNQISNVNCPMYVSFAICRPRADPSLVTATEIDQMFYNGNASLGPFNSKAYGSQYYPKNTAFWDYKYQTKWMKLGNQLYDNTNGNRDPNNDFKMSYTGVVNMAKIYPKLVRFNNNNQLGQNTYWWLVAFVQKVDLTGTVVGWIQPEISLHLNVKYEDS